MEKIKFHFITRCSRLHNLKDVGQSIFSKKNKKYDVTWHVIVDTSKVLEIETPLISYLNNLNTVLYFRDSKDTYLHKEVSETISNIDDGYIHIIDDDNILHPDYLTTLFQHIQQHKQPLCYVYNQKVNKKDFTGLDIRQAGPDYMKVSKIDLAQVTFHSSLFTSPIPDQYTGDGILIEQLYKQSPSSFKFIDKILCYYNYLTPVKKEQPTYHLPRVLVIGEKEEVSLKTSELTDFWETRLLVNTLPNDKNVTKALVDFNPDGIITIGKHFKMYPTLTQKPYDVRKRWVHVNKLKEDLGDLAYNVSMNSMLIDDTSELISFFTPTYNTGNKLYNTYQSLKEQSYDNWEWVIVDDSSDNYQTYKIAKDIANEDERVKVYSFREKSGGIIGESKYRAASLCSGKILAELDHDDILLERTAEYLNKAQKEYPDVGFFYSDCIEVDEKFNSLTYPEGFAFGYGSYYDFQWRGKTYKAAKECNINPKTIRHIVSVPNHIRAWRRSTYHQIKGHNRRLSIADDYELIVRTFLNTRMCRISYPGYLQLIYDNPTGTNTHNATRADIQRRVWSIANFYNEKIKDRFSELGVEDWAYKENPRNPTWTESRYGEEEGVVNLEFNIP